MGGGTLRLAQALRITRASTYNNTTSVVDRHRFDAGSKYEIPCLFHPDPKPDWHQNDVDPHADPTPTRSFPHGGKSDIFYYFLIKIKVF
jgi:hypothetical protein